MCIKTTIYCREELIGAMQKFNKQCIERPEDFNDELEATEEYATEQVDHLLSLVEKQKDI